MTQDPDEVSKYKPLVRVSEGPVVVRHLDASPHTNECCQQGSSRSRHESWGFGVPRPRNGYLANA